MKILQVLETLAPTEVLWLKHLERIAYAGECLSQLTKRNPLWALGHYRPDMCSGNLEPAAGCWGRDDNSIEHPSPCDAICSS